MRDPLFFLPRTYQYPRSKYGKLVSSLYHWIYPPKYLFVHINKCAGSSIRKSLSIPSGPHMTALELRQEVGLAGWRKAFTFAFVRNPWDRVLSQYLYRLKKNKHGIVNQGTSFEEWLRQVLQDQARPQYDTPRLFLPQTDWVFDANGELLVDYIGRFESLHEDMETVYKNIGHQFPFPHLNKTQHEHYSVYYSRISIALVAEVYARDVEIFGYTFDRA